MLFQLFQILLSMWMKSKSRNTLSSVLQSEMHGNLLKKTGFTQLLSQMITAAKLPPQSLIWSISILLWSYKKLVSNLVIGNVFTKSFGPPYKQTIIKTKTKLLTSCVLDLTKALALHKLHRSTKYILFVHHLGFEKRFSQINCFRYLKLMMLILLMLIYLAIHSHFSIVYTSLLILQNTQILHNDLRNVFLLIIEFGRLIASICCIKTSYLFQSNPKILMPLHFLTIYYIKLCVFFVRTLIWHFTPVW